jgi:cytochrome c-type biogenesis protein CcmH
MIKHPAFFFFSLILIALMVVVFYQLSSDPFKKEASGSGDVVVNPHQDDAIIGLYARECASCHGTVGQGVAGNPNLQNSRLSLAEIKSIISEGKGAMPAFPQIREPQLSELAELVKQFSGDE